MLNQGTQEFMVKHLACREAKRRSRSVKSQTYRSMNSLNFLGEFSGLTKNSIVTQKNLHMKFAYVIYDYWREKNLNKILESLIQSSIYSVGRFGGWNYSSMQEAFLDGQNTAELILQDIQVPIYNSHSIKKRMENQIF